MTIVGYRFSTRRFGTFEIRAQGGRWVVLCDDEALGWYQTPFAALEDLCGGSTDWPSAGNPANAGLPDDLSEWQKIVAR